LPEPTPSDAVTALLNAFQTFVPPQGAGLPQPGLTVAKTQTRPAGIGNLIGGSTVDSIAPLERRAVRVQATARFSLWGFASFDVDQQITALNTSIFAQQSALAAKGFLKLSMESSGPPEFSNHSSAWRGLADYDVLFELPYDDVGGASSLILPISARETATASAWSIRGDLGRWDEVGAEPLSIRGPAIFSGLAALAFFPDPANKPTGGVTISRTFDGAPAPAAAASLADFLTQITSSPSPARNVSFSFGSVADLLAQFTPGTTPIAMGDRNADGVPDSYASSQLNFPASLTLGALEDRFEMVYPQPKFDHAAVVYLRALRTGG